MKESDQVKQRSNGLATRKRLLDEACSQLATKGHHGVNINDVIRAAGISRSTFYHHFSNREELLEAVSEQLQEQVKQAMKQTNLSEKPFWLVSAMAAMDPALVQALLIDGLTGHQQTSGMLTDIRKQLAHNRDSGELKDDVDIEMASIIGFAGLYGALLACSMADNQGERLGIAERYAKEFERAFQHGVLDYKDSTLP